MKEQKTIKTGEVTENFSDLYFKTCEKECFIFFLLTRALSLFSVVAFFCFNFCIETILFNDDK